MDTDIRRFVLISLVAALLAGCSGTEAAAPTTAPAPTAAATPTADQVVSSLKTQLATDAVIVREITMESGALSTLTINYEANITKMPELSKRTAADAGAEIERSILIISKRLAPQIAAGFAVDRVNLVLKVQDAVIGSTRISGRDMLAWSQGKMSDGDYLASWAKTVNN